MTFCFTINTLIFQTEDIFVQLDVFDDLDKTTDA